MNTNLDVWYVGEWINIELGTKVLIAKCGSGKSVFGEYATLTKITKGGSLVFTTESGTKVSTKKENLRPTKKHEDYFISLHTNRDFIKSSII